MGKRLVIAVKPSVGMSIAAVLGVKDRKDGYVEGQDYIVSWGFGHLAELANADTYDERYAKWNYNDLPIVPANWKYKISKDKYNQFAALKHLMHREDVTAIINACDAGREGELIFRNIYNMAGCTKQIYRLWISSMEDSAIRQGFAELRDGKEYDNLYAAARCREWADWLVGINATRLFSVLYHRTLNVGRVVSPTLALLVQREAEIDAFKPEPFYTAELNFGSFTATSEKFKKKADAKAAISHDGAAVVKSVVSKEKSEKAPALYDLTTLQREANRQHGYTAQQTLDYVQSLYEKKLCTYLVDDTVYLHVQHTDEGWDYSLYDKESKKLIDGGILDPADIESSPVSSLAGAVRTEVFALQGMTPTKVVFEDIAILDELFAAQQSQVESKKADAPEAAIEPPVEEIQSVQDKVSSVIQQLPIITEKNYKSVTVNILRLRRKESSFLRNFVPAKANHYLVQSSAAFF